MNRLMQGLERVPATLLVILAVVSINLGSALAISLFPIYGTSGMLFLRMVLGTQDSRPDSFYSQPMIE